MKFGDRAHIGNMPTKRPSPKPSPTPRVYLVDLSTQATYEAGALLLTLLAFPKETADEQALTELHAALCMTALH